MAYTYDDFEKARAGSDVHFSQYDLDLAKQHPEFGMSVLDLKKQYAAAQTPEQRALINAQANELRKNYGNYSGGTVSFNKSLEAGWTYHYCIIYK